MIKRSLSTQFMLSLLAIMIIVAGAVLIVNYSLTSNRQQVQFEQNISTQIDVINAAFMEASYTYDFQQIQDISDALVNTALITQINVKDHRGKLLASAEENTSGDSSKKTIRSGIELKKDNETIAIYDITFTEAEMNRILRNQATSSVTMVIILAILVMFSVYFLMRQLVTIPVIKVAHRLNRIAEGGGDLRSRLKTFREDEIGELSISFNKVLDQISQIVLNVKNVTEKVNHNVGTMSSAAKMTVSTTDQQRTEIEHISTAISQLTTTSQEVANSAIETAKRTQEANDAVDQGSLVMHTSTETLAALTTQIESTANKILALKDSSQNIGSVMQVISNIAEQTNLLALNAAIEAARAGEQGRGFAVVADEVRSLAQKTQSSTEEISNIITQLQKAADEAHSSMNGSIKSTHQTIETSSKVEATLVTIKDSVATITDMNQQIATGAAEQNSVSGDVSHIISGIYSLSENIVTNANVIFDNTNELSKESKDLNNAMNSFKI